MNPAGVVRLGGALSGIILTASVTLFGETDALIEGKLPKQLLAGSTLSVPVKITNTGDEAWPPETLSLAYHWFLADGENLLWDGKRTPITARLAPGGTITIAARVVVPGERGVRLFAWDLVKEHHFWLSDLHPARMEKEPVKISGVAFEILHGRAPPILAERITRIVRVTVKNTGDFRWDPARGDCLSYHWIRSDGKIVVWDGHKNLFPRIVRPGEEVTWNVHVDTPGRMGKFHLAWDLWIKRSVWGSGNSAAQLRALPSQTILILNPRVMAMNILILLLLLLVVAKRSALPYLLLLWFPLSLLWKVSLFHEETHLHVILTVFGAAFLLFTGITAMVALLTPRRANLTLVVINIIFSLILIGDLVYFRYFHDLPSLLALGEVGQVVDVRASIIALLRGSDLLFFADLPLFIFFLVKAKPLRSRLLPAIVLVCTLPLILLFGVKADRTHPGVFAKRFKNVFLARAAGIAGYHFCDLADYITRTSGKTALTRAKGEELNAALSLRRATEGRPAATFGIGRGLNVIIDQEESWQHFLVDLTVDGEEVTPFLNALKRRSLWFPNTFDQTGAGRTSDCELAILNSIHPLPGISVNFRFSDNTFEALPKILARHGYRTLYAHPHEATFWNRDVMMPRYGFDQTLFKRDFSMTERLGWGLSDRAFFEQMLPRLANLPSPFFSFLVTLTGHHPYDELEPARQELKLPHIGYPILHDYLEVAHFKDEALRNFVEGLKAKGLWESSIFILYGDHDAGLNPEAVRRLLGEEPWNRLQYRLHDKIPLLIHLPGDALRGTCAKPSGQLSVGPMILHLLGIGDPHAYFFGSNTLSPDPAPVVLPDGSAVNEKFYYLAGPDTASGICYDRITKREVEVSACESLAKRAEKELNLSDLFLKSDAVEKLEKF